ncbi:hypothetical protein K7X08_011794 [Anisodus acutangulus]|uniref:Uncharacterized protein n=1 Tax=Anisodus acutangulus TaxID=402998 RepID=A0A9Q1RIW1_9SOLA|nr:hypothetical protein K7X08_011794 [Anisodus acutangulus]
MRYHGRRYLVQKYLPKFLFSGKTLTYPRNTKGNDKRKDVEKCKGIKLNDKEVYSKNKFDVLNQCIEEEKSEDVESNRTKQGSNANKDIVVDDSTTAKVIDAPTNNAVDVGITDYVTIEPMHNKKIEEEYIMEIEGGIDNNIEVNEVNNDHEANKVIIEQQLQESMGHSENKEEDTRIGTKQVEEAPIIEESQLSKRGVGSFPPSREEFTQVVEVSRYDLEEVLDEVIKQLQGVNDLTSQRKHIPLHELHDVVSHNIDFSAIEDQNTKDSVGASSDKENVGDENVHLVLQKVTREIGISPRSM